MKPDIQKMIFKQISSETFKNILSKSRQDQVEYLYDSDHNDWAQGFQLRTRCVFKPHKALASPYLQMFIHRMLHRKLHVPYIRQTTTYKDGELCVLDIVHPINVLGKPGDIILFVCHGLGGNSDSYYCKRLAHHAAKQGLTTIVYNRRGHLLPNKSKSKPFPYHYDRNDTDTALRLVKSLYPNNKKLVGVGFSMGSNLIVKYIGDLCSEDCNPFHGVISVSNGFHVQRGVDALAESKQVADAIAAQFMHDVLDHHPHLYDARQEHAKVKSFKALDAAIMKHVYGAHFDMNLYYDAISCHKVLDQINIPVLAIASKDDPFLCNQVDEMHHMALELNKKNMCCVLTTFGGHIGWLDGLKCGSSWLYKMCIDFCKTVN